MQVATTNLLVTDGGATEFVVSSDESSVWYGKGTVVLGFGVRNLKYPAAEARLVFPIPGL